MGAGESDREVIKIFDLNFLYEKNYIEREYPQKVYIYAGTIVF